jgi:hypothetical protein
MWNNMIEIGDGTNTFDFDAYIQFLVAHNHNFIRLWTWETTTWDTTNTWSPKVVRQVPLLRYAHAVGKDGAIDNDRFDLEAFEPEYFDRMKSRIRKASENGIYVSVMLFEGWCLQFAPNSWQDHPYHPNRNVNGIGIGYEADDSRNVVFSLRDNAILARQEAYVRKVVDTVNEFDNVLYEVSNENRGDSKEWQYHVIHFLNQYQSTKPQQHPVGMTHQHEGGLNRMLFDSPANWISPSPEGGYGEEPPVADGSKVIVNDTDHIWGIGGTADWVWKNVTRGNNVLLMDPYDETVIDRQNTDWRPEPVRIAMGQANTLAQQIDLAYVTPQPALATTGYCLAATGETYVVYCPEGGDVRVNLQYEVGPFQARWLSTNENNAKWESVDDRVAGDGQREFHLAKAPGVLWLSLVRD